MVSKSQMNMVFILGLGRSGSTLLDLVLGGHPDMIGLGEVVHLMVGNKNAPKILETTHCSCGKRMPLCDFWGNYVELLNSREIKGPEENYDNLIAYFNTCYGNNKTLVDSSKKLSALMTISNLNVRVKVIFLVRDVRGWTYSIIRSKKMNHEYKIAEIMKKYKLKKSFRKIVARNISSLFWLWYLENKKMKNYLLKQKNFSWLQLGYDELALYPKLSIKYVYEFLDIEYLDPFSSLSSTESHNIFGNYMRNQKYKRSGIYYDNRWFNSQKWIPPWILFPQISFYNQQLVYGNVKTPFIG